ncbi:hypothetical protein GA0070558_15122 [Micromonospora haikouensis]|uniref:Phospholipase D-like domain-containing protein n=1 Tax=Micromonospora haikouensis TaxID=686309 RepID=A0A1C4YJU2_9ACTN|nr:phospholipase D-like domain-containing protein DpdK [Micromonospora haikouensis]SCF21013.1 hypothetical protein GA0070558_15122 [Micromonospora haikouensis]
MILERVVRTGRKTGLRIDNLLSAVLLGELVTPSANLWLVSPWISDVDVIDNMSGRYDSVFAEPANRRYPLSEVLGILTHSGANLTVVTRPESHNKTFLDRLFRQADAGRLLIVEEEDVHEKTFCGELWILTGSMNLTVRGMQVNDEAVTYKYTAEAAASARLDLRRRFGGLA